MRTAASLVAMVTMVLAPAGALAQGAVVRSFEQLTRARLLEEGDTIWIVSDVEGSGEYRQMKAEFISLTEGTIVVHVDSLPSGGSRPNAETR